MSDTALIVGLGNPGPRFAETRHNIGWKVLDLVSSRVDIPINERRPKAVLGIAAPTEFAAWCWPKPRTFMNNSGEAVEYICFPDLASRPFQPPRDLRRNGLLPGRIRLRASGSDAGHKDGIRSIIQAVGGTGFPRLRIGIGAPPPGLVARDYVLGKFEDDESESILGAVDRAAAAVLCVLEEGIDVAMNRFNQDPSKQEDPPRES